MTQAVGRCTDAVQRGGHLSIGMVNAAKVVAMHRDEQLRHAVAGSGMVLADGQSVVWASRMLGSPVPERVAGIDLFLELLDEPPVIWRKVTCGDRRRLRRGLRAASGRFRPEIRRRALDGALQAGSVDHECRPYEPGWLLFGWLPAGAGL